MSGFSKNRLKHSRPRQELLKHILRQEGLERAAAETILPRQGNAPIPLSFQQQGLWLLCQLDSDNPAYNENCLICFNGHLDVPALERSMSEILTRHEALRTTFRITGDRPVQIIEPAFALRLPVVSFQNLSAPEQNRRLEQFAVEEASRPFDLVRGPMLRLHLVKLSETEHSLLMIIHHIISDGYSIEVFIRELAAHYEAISKGGPSDLPGLTIQYADYAIWQHQSLQGRTLGALLDYWRRHLDGAPAVLELPRVRPRPAKQTFRGATISAPLLKTLSEDLQRLSSAQGVTLFVTLLAAFQVLLYRYTGQDDIVVGTPVAGRGRGQTEPLIGFFVNTIPLRSRLSGDASFLELLKQVREVTLAGFAHQDLPFEKLVEALQPNRDLSHSPLFQILFALQVISLPELVLPGLRLTTREVNNRTSKYDLMLLIRQSPQSLHASIEYNTDLFDSDFIDSFLSHFIIMLEGVVSDPNQHLSQLPLMNTAERDRILVEWNDSFAPYPSEVCVHQLFEAQAARTPDRVAVVSGHEQLAYGELNSKANQLARHLVSLGVGPDVIVGICVDRSWEMVVGVLGILKAGGAYLPIDPAYPPQRLAFMLEDAQLDLLVTRQELTSSLPQHQGRLICLDRDWPIIVRQPPENPASSAGPRNLAYVLYTSGSTGRPKAVAIEHHSAATLLHWAHGLYSPLQLSAVLSSTSLCFDLSVFELFAPLTCGGKVVLADNVLELMSLPPAGVSLINTVPSAIAQLIKLQGVPGSVRTINLAGEPLQKTLVEQVYQRTDVAEVFNLYGPTEATTYSTFDLMERDGKEQPFIGRPVSNTQVYVLDQHLEPVPVCAQGGLYIAGAGLARGYLNHPELTAIKFIPNPFGNQPGSRMYKTGDVARYLAGGKIDFIGRVDRQIKLRGFRIELGEVETALGDHPCVREVAVMLREDAPDNKSLVAYVICKQGMAVAETDLRNYLKEKLPVYMLPSSFVFIEALPLTPNGKINREMLPAPDQAGHESAGDFSGPGDPLQEVLCGIWEQVLKTGPVGINDNFFELGGHSLLATQVISQAREIFHAELSLRSLFESPTVASLAVEIEKANKTRQAPRLPDIEKTSREAELEPSFAQQRLWLFDQLYPGNSSYNIPAAARLKGRLNAKALELALSEVVRRHETMRTTFASVDGRPVQVIGEPAPFRLSLIDLGGLRGQSEAQAQRVAMAMAQQSFDLTRGPLFRACLLRLKSDDHMIVFTMHHIISDGWSIGVLIREMAALYGAFSEGNPSPLADPALQYVDYSCWQRDWMRGDVLEDHLLYWRQRLDGAPPLLELPSDRPRQSVQSFQGNTFPFMLPEKLSEKLRALSRSEGSTLFITLVAAFQTLLHRYTGQQDIIVSSGVANRMRNGLEGLIGCFINILPLRTDLSGDPIFRALLHRVREICLEAYNYQDLPFELLVQALHPDRDLSHTPVTQVMVVLHSAPTARLELSDISVDIIESVEGGGAQFDLSLSLLDSDQNLKGWVVYNRHLFDSSTVARMIGHFQTLLEAITADRDQPLSRLPVSGEAEQFQILVEWNDTRVEFEGLDKRLHRLFEAQVERNPDACALLFNNERMTYGELNREANRLARYLRGLGVGPDDLVGICIQHSPEMVVAMQGVLKAGAAYVPLDPAYPKERLSFMLRDSRPSLILTTEELSGALPEAGARLIRLDSLQAALEQMSDANLDNSADVNNLAYVIYTSGSTGVAKGIALRHQGVANNILDLNDRFSVGPGDRILAVSSLSFDMCVYEVIGALAAGGTIILPEPAAKHDPAHWAELIIRHRVTVWNSAPPLLKVLVDFVNNRPALWPRCLRLVILGGDWVPIDLPGQIKALTESAQVISLGGATEASIHSIVYPVEESDPAWKSIPYGIPMSNQKAYVLDKNLCPVPAGIPGELHLGGIGLARGYFNRPDFTAEKFVPDPFSRRPGGRIYKTGDLARYLRDGNIELLGRIDHQVKIRGFRIEPGEIEAVLRQHPGVEEAVVMAREYTGSHDRRLVAYIVPDRQSGSHSPDKQVADFRHYSKERLPDYMVPADYVLLDKMPLSPNGKVYRQALPAPAARQAAQEFDAPIDPFEELLAEIWVNVLGIESVGRQDNFFDLGGHSLLATQVASRVQEAFNVDLPLRHLFLSPTVAGLAENIVSNGGAPRKKFIEIAQVLAQINRLSKEEVEAMIAERASLQDEADNKEL